MIPSSTMIADLRSRIGAVDARGSFGKVLPFDVEAVDGRLVGCGLACHGLHEIAAASEAMCDDAAATLFLAGIGARFARTEGTVVWIVTRFDLYAPGLEQAGLGPGRVLFVEARDDLQVLACMEDALRHGGVAAVVGEVRRADMTATRRLQLPAGETGTPALLLRRWRRRGVDPLLENSAAMTRWRIGSAPSAPLGHAGVGRARWRVELVRQRNGAPFDTVLEACDATGMLALPAAPRHRAGAARGEAARAA